MMVRSTIACAWCRRSKIKCIHQGEPPCRNCIKSQRTRQGDCVLSGPDLSSKKTRRNTSQQPENNSAGRATPTPQPPDDAEHTPNVSDRPSPDISFHDAFCEGQFGKTIHDIAFRAATSFQSSFPELAFLHLATFNARHPEQRKTEILDATLVLLCSRLRKISGLPKAKVQTITEDVRSKLSQTFMESPSLEMVQALLVFSMYEWGNGKGYSAWMLTGTAIRMMQSLEALGHPKSLNEEQQEIYNRTFWSCFIMDRFVICGKNQPFSLPIEQMVIHLPIGDQDYAFGHSLAPRLMNQDIINRKGCHNGIDHCYSILVRGFDIWSRILKWILNGGRRQVNSPNCPWIDGSPWRNLYDEIERWRQLQDHRIKYPTTSVAVHVSLGHGEAFVLINLIYYISLLFLGREYIPFLPKPNAEPQGPVDPPLLDAVAPDGWWAERAEGLFNAAAQITHIIEQLKDLGHPLLTPFPGFCVFSAATMNTYIANFPRMNFNKSSTTGAATLLDRNIAHLKEFKSLWPMGDGWFKTIQQTRNLYEKASRDYQRYQGKTRADFEALEASIHDYSGVSPAEDDQCPTENATERLQDDEYVNGDTTADLDAPYPHHIFDLAAIDADPSQDMSLFNQWNEVWPLWGEHQFMPCHRDGILYDYNGNNF